MEGGEMGRRLRASADYFPHDIGMRNDPKVRAAVARYGADAYAVWNLTLELCGQDPETCRTSLDAPGLIVEAATVGLEEVRVVECWQLFDEIGLVEYDRVDGTHIIACPKQRRRFEPMLERRQKQRDEWREKKAKYRDKKAHEAENCPEDKIACPRWTGGGQSTGDKADVHGGQVEVSTVDMDDVHPWTVHKSKVKGKRTVIEDDDTTTINRETTAREGRDATGQQGGGSLERAGGRGRRRARAQEGEGEEPPW
jgi:hypothetical protein